MKTSRELQTDIDYWNEKARYFSKELAYATDMMQKRQHELQDALKAEAAEARRKADAARR